MRTFFTAAAITKKEPLAAGQTLNGRQRAKWPDRDVSRPFLTGYSRPVQACRGYVCARSESDFMRSQLG